MTNHWIDLKNSDCILIMGSNAAENHPISFKYVTKAMQNGAKLINVDPRFTRTSAKADIYTALRSGTDIAFLGGMIELHPQQQPLQRGVYRRIYQRLPLSWGKRLDSRMVSFPATQKGTPMTAPPLADTTNPSGPLRWMTRAFPKWIAASNIPDRLFQLLKNHYSRYTPDVVSKITGTSEADLLEVYKTFAETGAKGKAGTIMYAMGWTQHTVGTQIIRTMAMIQLLLGNMGVAGGGVNALRGESNVQGSTDTTAHSVAHLAGISQNPESLQHHA